MDWKGNLLNKWTNNVSQHLSEINNLRNANSINEIVIMNFINTIPKKIVKSGNVLRVFMMHLARPLEVPILDRFAILTYDVVTGQNISLLINRTNFISYHYLDYRDYILKLQNQTGSSIREIDRAFWVYGKHIL
ncbi:MAG: hypothetical protein JW776_16920 [Candidatus Lokiarchaeota archaeon]|nr:hypothetical protein [Candidatus Lokiarchaeota archaeon]